MKVVERYLQKFLRKYDRETHMTHDDDQAVAVSMGESQWSKQKEALDANDRNSKKTMIKMQKRIRTRNSTNQSIQISLIFHRWYGNLSLHMILCVFRFFESVTVRTTSEYEYENDWTFNKLSSYKYASRFCCNVHYFSHETIIDGSSMMYQMRYYQIL